MSNWSPSEKNTPRKNSKILRMKDLNAFSLKAKYCFFFVIHALFAFMASTQAMKHMHRQSIFQQNQVHLNHPLNIKNLMNIKRTELQLKLSSECVTYTSTNSCTEIWNHQTFCWAKINTFELAISAWQKKKHSNLLKLKELVQCVSWHLNFLRKIMVL